MYTSRMSKRYYGHATTQDIRRVWAAVSAAPQSTLRELASTLGMHFSGVGAALRLLKDAGYIDFPKGTDHARTILIPFIELKKDH